MKTIKLICICLLVVILLGEQSLGCGSSPDPTFDMPSFIDIEYKAPYYSDVKYKKWDKVKRLINRFVTSKSIHNSISDTSYRSISFEEETDAFLQYQQGAKYFQTYDYKNALNIFIELKDIRGPEKGLWAKLFNIESYSWVKEASTYMTARCQLIMAQKKWNGYRNPTEIVDQKMLLSADSSYRYYLNEFPDGLYSYSARGVFRKIYYLMGKRGLLDLELIIAVKEHFEMSSTIPQININRLNIMAEFIKLFRGNIDIVNDSPILCAYKLLTSDTPDSQDIILIQNRKSDFEAYPGLYEYCQTIGLYKMDRYQELLEIALKDPDSDTILWLSTQLLRARAYAKQGDTLKALNSLIGMHEISPEDAIEVEIATLMFNNGEGLWLFSDNSPIKNYSNLRIFALHGLTDKELELGITKTEISEKKRKMLADELAQRYLLSGRYEKLNYLFDNNLSSIFLPIKEISERLVTNPKDIKALADMGEYLFKNNIRPHKTFGVKYFNRWTGSPDADLPNCKPCQNYYERTELNTPPAYLFLTIIDIAKKQKIKSEAEAKALHYIVVGGRNQFTKGECFWSRSFEKNENYISNKDAFIRLHKLYPKSPWTKATPYFYE